MYIEEIIWADGGKRKMTNETLESAINYFEKNKILSELVSSELYKGNKLIATYDREEGYKWINPKFTISKELAALVEEKRGKYSLAQEVEERGEDHFKFFDVNEEMWDMFDQNPDWFEDRLVTTAGVYPYGIEKIGKVIDVLYHHGYAIEGEELVGQMEGKKIVVSTDPLIKLSEHIYDKIVENDGDIVTFLCNACTNAAQGKEVTFVKEAHKGL